MDDDYFRLEIDDEPELDYGGVAAAAAVVVVADNGTQEANWKSDVGSMADFHDMCCSAVRLLLALPVTVGADVGATVELDADDAE